MLLAAIYALFGRQFFMNRLFLSLLGTATCWLVFRLATDLGLEKRVALRAAFITAILPLQFYFCGHFMSEIPAGFFVVACTLLLTRALSRHRVEGSAAQPSDPRRFGSPSWLFLGAGLVCGIAVLVRPSSTLLPGMLAFLLLVFRAASFKRIARWSVLFGIGTFLVVLPWTIRNARVFQRFCLVSTTGGSTFWGANNRVVAQPSSGVWGSWISTNFDLEVKKREVWSLSNEVDQDRKESQIGREWLMANPGKIPALMAGKVWRLINPFPLSNNRAYALIVGVGQILLLPLFVVGLALVLRDREKLRTFLPILAQLLCLGATSMIFYPCDRFRMPYEPFMAIFAAMALERWRFRNGPVAEGAETGTRPA
jgi:4-amino-4-deoxy-L-arabinose transferase-like glycosyltransferase